MSRTLTMGVEYLAIRQRKRKNIVISRNIYKNLRNKIYGTKKRVKFD